MVESDSYVRDIGEDAENIRERMNERISSILSAEGKSKSVARFDKKGKPHHLGLGGRLAAELVCLCGTFFKSRAEYDRHIEEVTA